MDERWAGQSELFNRLATAAELPQTKGTTA
jgi:hypothetical protein